MKGKDKKHSALRIEIDAYQVGNLLKMDYKIAPGGKVDILRVLGALSICRHALLHEKFDRDSDDGS